MFVCAIGLPRLAGLFPSSSVPLRINRLGIIFSRRFCGDRVFYDNRFGFKRTSI